MIWLILLFGFGLRLISLNQSLWLDEATTSSVASRFSFSEIITKFSPADFHPPLYYLVLRGWSMVFGFSEISLRIPSVIFGVVTIYVVYLIGKNIFNKKVGLVSSLFLATGGLHIYYSQEARMYALTALFVSCLVYLFIKKRWLLFSASLVLLGMTDYVALLIVPIFWIVGRKDWRKLVISHLPLAISYFFWLPILLQQFSAGLAASQSAWGNLLGRSSLKEIILIPVKFMLGRISFEDKWLYGLLVAVVSSIYGYLLFRSIRLMRSIRNLKLLLLWLIVPVILAVVIAFKLPILSYFRLLFVLPAFYLLLAGGTQSLPKRWRNLFVVLILFVNLTSSILYLVGPRFQREDWRSMAKALGSSKIVFPANSQKEALSYYGKGDQIINSDQIYKKGKEIWLSRYVWEVFDPSDIARQRIESLGYNKTDEYNFNGVVVWKYLKL